MCDYRLFEGDCLEILPRLIEEEVKVDLVVTSPPYDNLRDYEGKTKWSFDIFKRIANKLYNILKDNGVIVWIVNDSTIEGSETGTSFKQALYFKKIGLNLHDTMIYKKKGVVYPYKNRYYPIFEYMFVFSKGKPKTVNLIKDRKNKNAGSKITTSVRQKDGSIKKSNGAKNNRITKKYGVRTNIWEYSIGAGNSSKDKRAFQHPAIFPYNLARDHILSWSNTNDLILDCFMGSGSTGVACANTGRQFIGIEIEHKYYTIAKKRIQEAYNQTKLI